MVWLFFTFLTAIVHGSPSKGPFAWPLRKLNWCTRRGTKAQSTSDGPEPTEFSSQNLLLRMKKDPKRGTPFLGNLSLFARFRTGDFHCTMLLYVSSGLLGNTWPSDWSELWNEHLVAFSIGDYSAGLYNTVHLFHCTCRNPYERTTEMRRD